jgi:ribonucleoside-diphosphate reductase alpha chain
LDWEALRVEMKQYGIRNATLMAIAPVESSSVVINSTNGINLAKQLIIIKESKAGAFAQVVPEYRRLKKNYQLLWDQSDCIDYIKTVAVLQVFVDQGISADTFYSPKFFPEGKVPVTLIAKNLMLASKWGVKSFYYDLRDKQGTKDMLKHDDFNAKNNTVPESEEDDHACESCVL